MELEQPDPYENGSEVEGIDFDDDWEQQADPLPRRTGKSASRKKAKGVRRAPPKRTRLPFLILLITSASCVVFGVMVWNLLIRGGPRVPVVADNANNPSATDGPVAVAEQLAAPAARPLSDTAITPARQPASAKTNSAWLAEANDAFSKDDYEKTIVTSTEALKLDPQSAVAYNLRGVANLRIGNPLFGRSDGPAKIDRALQDFNDAIQIKPTARVYANRAIVFHYRKNYSAALADLTRAIELEPTNPEWHKERGQIYFDMEDEKQASEDFTIADQLKEKVGSVTDPAQSPPKVAIQSNDDAPMEVQKVVPLTEDEQTARKAALSDVGENERVEIAKLNEEVQKLKKEIELKERAITTYQKSTRRITPTLQAKGKALEEAKEKLASAIQNLDAQKIHFADERGKIKVRYAIEGDLYGQLDGHYLPVKAIERIKRERRESLRRQAEVEAGPNGTAQKAAEEYVKELVSDGTLQAAETTLLQPGVIEVFGALKNVSIPKDLAAGQFESTSPGHGLLRTWLVFFKVRYVSKAGIVNEREAYVPVVKLSSGMWVYIYDDGLALRTDENGTPLRSTNGRFISGGFSLPKGGF